MTKLQDWFTHSLLGIILIGGFLLSYISVPFADNLGNNFSNVTLISFCILFFLLITSRFQRSITSPFSHKFILVTLLLISIFVFSIFVSLSISITILEIAKWILGIVLFYSVSQWIYSRPEFFSRISSVVIYTSSILVLIGINLYTTQLGYQRFGSVLYQHNAFASFIIPAVVLSWLFTFTSKTKQLQNLYLIQAVLTSCAFILTLSRGAWLSLLCAVVIVVFITRKGIFFRKNFLSKRLWVLIILIGLLTSLTYYLSSVAAEIQQTPVRIYDGQTIPETASLSRLYYFADAIRFTTINPIGVGLGNYSVASQMLRDRVPYYAFNPHNIYLKMFTEIGIIGGLLFLVFILMILWPIIAYVKKTRDPTVSALLIGIIAILIHNGMDIGFNFTLNIMCFFIVAGLAMGLVLSKTNPKEKPGIFSKNIMFTFCCVAIGISFLLIPVYIGSNALEDAKYFQDNGDADNASLLLSKAEHYYPFDYLIYIYRGGIYYSQALGATGETKKRLLGNALAETVKAEHYRNGGTKTYQAESAILQELGDMKGSTLAMEKSVQSDPLNNLDRHVRLVDLYVNQGEYSKAIDLVDYTLTKFPIEIFGQPAWADPNQGMWRAYIVDLLKREKAIYTLLENKEQQEIIEKKIKLYSI